MEVTESLLNWLQAHIYAAVGDEIVHHSVEQQNQQNHHEYVVDGAEMAHLQQIGQHRVASGELFVRQAFWGRCGRLANWPRPLQILQVAIQLREQVADGAFQVTDAVRMLALAIESVQCELRTCRGFSTAVRCAAGRIGVANRCFFRFDWYENDLDTDQRAHISNITFIKSAIIMYTTPSYFVWTIELFAGFLPPSRLRMSR